MVQERQHSGEDVTGAGHGAILAALLATEFGSGSRVSREKELSVYVSSVERRSAARRGNRMEEAVAAQAFALNLLRAVYKEIFLAAFVPHCWVFESVSRLACN